jgi:hypothetical protein
MSKAQEPVVLELAPLPRERMGPYFVLGLDKDADSKEIEANWARRVIQARKQQVPLPLESVNWARDVVNDPVKRVRADVTSLNSDTADRLLSRLEKRYTTGPTAGDPSPFRDHEKPLADYTPNVELPDAGALRGSLITPEVPDELPAVAERLKRLSLEPIDPWALPLPPESSQESPA